MLYTNQIKTFVLAVVALLPVVAWGQTDITTEEALRQAITDASTDATIVKIDADITLPDGTALTIATGQNITLDLNGHTITAVRDVILNSGKLTLKDGSEGQNGTLVSTTRSGIGLQNNSVTVIESGSIKAVEGCVVTGTAVGAQLTIRGGTFTCTDNAVIAGNGSSEGPDGILRETPNTIIISGGTFNGQIKSAGYVACGIYCPWKDNVTVSGGTFNITGGAGIVARSGTVTVTGGTFNCTGNVTGKVGDSRVVVPCSPVVFDSEAAYPSMTDESKIEVTAGTSMSENGIPVKVVAKEGDAEQRVAVSGGSYSAPVSQEYCAEGFTTAQNADGTYGVSSTFTVSDSKPLSISSADDFTVGTATYTREMPAGTKWGTVCLPFNITSTEEVPLYTINRIEDGKLYLDKKTEAEAGTPVIFHANSTSVTFTTENARVKGASPTTEVSLAGTYTDLVIKENLGSIYYINSDAFHQAKASLRVPAYRAYIIYNKVQGAKPSVLFIGDGTTGIEETGTAPATTKACYSVGGVRRSAAVRGLNIVRLSDGRTIKVVK